jgi:hypothetical protein
MDISLFLFLVVAAAPAGTIIHESGHLLGACIAKADHMSLSIGKGKRIFSFSLSSIHITIYAFFFLGGFAHSRRKMPYQRKEMIWITACGLLSSSLFAAFFYLMYNTYENSYLQLLFLFNGWLAVVNSIPFKINGKQSDGYAICRLILQKAG